MESTDVKKVQVSKKATSANLRVKIETRKRLLSELAKINKKSFGRKVRVDQILNLLLDLLKQEHIQKLQDGSLSNADRIEMSYRDYIKKNGNVSKDEFLGILLKQESLSSLSGAAFVDEKTLQNK
ncbi:MAG TPA: hypothetical protein VF412_19250 [Bdellovibrio sp.]|uniref:hypothetical protein n=1 Tax=Bdellovibrio sp. TaxID=28201 RepID=UPI002F21F6F7